MTGSSKSGSHSRSRIPDDESVTRLHRRSKESGGEKVELAKRDPHRSAGGIGKTAVTSVYDYSGQQRGSSDDIGLVYHDAHRVGRG